MGDSGLLDKAGIHRLFPRFIELLQAETLEAKAVCYRGALNHVPLTFTEYLLRKR